MATVKMGVSSLPATGLVAKALGYHDEMVAHALTFPDPDPTRVVYKGHIDALVAANAYAEVNGGKPAFAAKRAAAKQVRADVKKLASYVQMVSGGDAAIIVLAGFEVVQQGANYGQPNPPVNLNYLLTRTARRVSLRWQNQPGVDMHHVFMSAANDPFKWDLVGSTPKSRFIMDGLVSGQLYHFAITAIGAAGESSMSEPFQVYAA